MILAPLRGVTIRCFRETFAEEIRAAGFTEAITPFITAIVGYDPLKDRELANRTIEAIAKPRGNGRAGVPPPAADGDGTPSLPGFAIASIDQSNNRTILLTPQFIGKDPVALRDCLEKVKAAGYETADLNCGCPFPMVRNKGRGSGILRTPDVLRRMLEVGCETMGAGKFSMKARLGIDRTDELLKLMPMINEFPLRFLTVHARTARQMYEGSCEVEMVEKVESVAKVPIVVNGDIEFPVLKRSGDRFSAVMIGRGFVRWLGTREDSGELLERYIAASRAELCGDRPVLGRMKELIAYWKDLPRWRRRWDVIKICRSVDELRTIIW